MHDWRFVSTRRRPLNSYGSGVESTWKCVHCGVETNTDDDEKFRPYAHEADGCEIAVVRKVMES